MKLQSKLTGAFCILALITLGVAALGYLQVKKLGSALYEIGVVRLPSIQGLDAMREAEAVLTGSLRSLVLAENDAAVVAEELRRQEQAWRQAGEGWALYEPLPQTVEEALKWQAFKPAWAAWKSDYEAVRDGILRSRQTGDAAALAAAYQRRRSVTENLGATVRTLLGEIVAINDRIVLEQKRRSVASQSDVVVVQNLMLGAAVFGFAAAIGLGVFLAGRISRSVCDVCSALTRVGAGDLSARIEVRSRDEIGVMAGTMNEMVEALRTSEARLQVLSDNLPYSMVYQVTRRRNGSMRFLHVSAGIERMHGVTAAAALGNPATLYDQIVEPDRAAFRAAERHSEETLTLFDSTVRVRRADGELRWMHIRSAPRRLADGCVLWDGIETDITEQRRAEEGLRENELRLRTVIEGSNDGIWEWEIASGVVQWSNRVYEMFGAKPGSFGVNFDRVVELVHPEDREYFHAALKGHLEMNLPYDIELRFRHEDGGYGSFVCKGKTLRDAAGKPLRMVGSITDATERRRMEESLKMSEGLLRQFVKHTPAAVAMFDHSMRYLQVSDRWLADYQLGEATIIGRSHYDVFPDVPERWKLIHQRVLAGAVERCDEDPFPRADGGMEWLQWELRPWKKAEGQIGGLVMFTQVITGRKRTEQKIADQLKELQRWQRVTLDREERIGQLKAEINELCARAGQPLRYAGRVAEPEPASAHAGTNGTTAAHDRAGAGTGAGWNAGGGA